MEEQRKFYELIIEEEKNKQKDEYTLNLENKINVNWLL